jgi:hypothetical protein
MADLPPIRIRRPGGDEYNVAVSFFPGVSEQSVKEAVADALGLPVGSFFLRTPAPANITTVFHAGLVGNFDAIRRPQAFEAKARFIDATGGGGFAITFYDVCFGPCTRRCIE